ncbi:MAG: hypothetical protein FWE14_09075 [Lachnospiraceae bacterium]|nr:hypothetical protein [Lachnospiraceae bacterium]
MKKSFLVSLKDKKFSKQIFFLFGVLVGFILFGAIFIGWWSDRPDDDVIRITVLGTPESNFLHNKEIELKTNLRKFDKIDNAIVNIGTTDGEIGSVSVFLRANEDINETEMDEIILFISESFDNLNKKNIYVEYSSEFPF